MLAPVYPHKHHNAKYRNLHISSNLYQIIRFKLLQQDEGAPIPQAFEYVGWPVAKWIVSIGAIFGLLTR